MDTEGIMASVYELAAELLEKACQSIKEEMAAKDINATGNTSESFRVERYEGGVRLVMGGTEAKTAPLETLEVGRPAGDVPGGFRTTKDGTVDVSNTFKAILVDWAKAKGIEGFGWGAATMLGRRIAKEGTLRHRNPTNVYSRAVTDAERELVGKAAVTVTDKIHEELIKITP